MALLPSSAAERARRPVTVLRVHGVGGWSSTETLMSTDVVQVAGDDLSGFYRRPGPVRAGDASDGTPAPGEGPVAEAYSWGLFSSKAPAQAFWLLLIPFTLVNLACWMLQGHNNERPRPDLPHEPSSKLALPLPWLGALLRVVGLILTLEFFLAVTGVTVGVMGAQCGTSQCHTTTISLAWLPQEFSWIRHPGLPSALPNRLAMTVLVTLLVLVSQWWLCWLTRRRYEQWPPRHHVKPPVEVPAGNTFLSHHGFWLGDERVWRLAMVHTAAVLGLLTWIADACTGTARNRPIELLAIAVVAASVVIVATDKAVGLEVFHDVDQEPKKQGRRRLFWFVAASAVLLGYACWRLWFTSKSAVGTPTFMPGWTAAFVVGAAIQGVLLIVVLVALLTTGQAKLKPANKDNSWTPFVRGFAPVGVASLGVGLAAVATAGAITVAELSFVTTKKVDGKQPSTQTLLPHVFKDLDAGAVCFMVVLAVVLVVLLVRGLVNDGNTLWRQAATEVEAGSDVVPPTEKWGESVRATVWSSATGRRANADLSVRRRVAVWQAYLIGHAPEALFSFLMGAAPIGLVAGALLAVPFLKPVRNLVSDGNHAGIATGLLAALTFAAMSLLYSERNADRRRAVGILWDVATFWPRAAHPFAPPCYAERAVPELTHRLTWLVQGDPRSVGKAQEEGAGQAAPAEPATVVLLGYSQGAPIVAAALMALPLEVRAHIHLLTMGCPLRRLYARGYPDLFGQDALTVLVKPGDEGPQWRNVWRSTDFIGSWVMNKSDQESSRWVDGCRDVWLSDPISFGPIDGDTAFPPANEHFDFFSDDKVAEQLQKILSGQLEPDPKPAGADPAAPADPVQQKVDQPAAADPKRGG